MNILVDKMKSSYIQYWRSELGDVDNVNGKLHLYRKIKHNFVLEGYLNKIKSQKYRKAISCLRISAHRLEIEIGRYAKRYIPRHERICSLCTNCSCISKIGDELHAIMECCYFKNERETLFNEVSKICKNFMKLDTWHKFVYLLTVEGPSLLLFGRFVYKVLSVKRDAPV